MKKTYTAVFVLAAILNTGCDSTCCEVPQKAPEVTAIDNYKINGDTVTCNTDFLLSATAKDADSDLDPAGYQWTVDEVPVSTTSISCPLPDQTKQVCVTAIDKLSHQSDPFCLTLKGAADNSHPPVIHSLGGITQNNTTVNCNDISMPLSVNSSDIDNDFDHYVWKVDGQEVQFDNINCPQPVDNERVCVTAYDKVGNQSNEFCVTIQKQDCNPVIIAKDSNDTIIGGDTLTPGNSYKFEYDVSSCPTTIDCKWSVKSHKPNRYMICMTNNEIPSDQNGTNHAVLDSSNNKNLIVNTCPRQYDYDRLYITLSCTSPDANKTKVYTFQ